MKKVWGILIVGLLVCNSAYAYRGEIWDYLKVGMSKKQFRKVVDGGWSYGNTAITGGIAVDYNLSKEITKLRQQYGWKYICRVFIYDAYSEYFSEYNTEILSHRGCRNKDKSWKAGFGIKKSPEHWIYYIFENVTNPKNCDYMGKRWRAPHAPLISHEILLSWLGLISPTDIWQSYFS